MAEQKSTIVLVHGAFAESASWDLVIERCQAEHHQFEAGLRPTLGEHSLKVVAAANPLRSVAGDAAYVRDVIAGVSGPVVLVAHSYGGFVITEAAARNESVVGLVYVNAFAPEQGESAFGLAAKFPGGSADAFAAYPISTGGVEFAIRQDLFHHAFAADIPARRAAVMGATQRPATEKAFTDGLPTDAPAWKSIPSWFVFGELDLVIPAALHRFMADRAGPKGALEVAGASHALMVSNPDAVAAMILTAVNAVNAVSGVSAATGSL
jgi:pimeloyl-ACP methyl ester carboxylesterase